MPSNIYQPLGKYCETAGSLLEVPRVHTPSLGATPHWLERVSEASLLLSKKYSTHQI